MLGKQLQPCSRNFWVVRQKTGLKWAVLDHGGKHVMSHDFLCDAEGVPAARGMPFVIISSRTNEAVLGAFRAATGTVLKA